MCAAVDSGIAVVDPGHIATERPGVRALYAAVGEIADNVVMVSADRLEDERTGQPYYLAKVELPEEPTAHHPDLRIQPGMQAEVMIITGERTALDYLMEPLTRSLRRSFREQ